MRSSISYSAPSADELYREIDRLTVERDFLSRKLDQKAVNAAWR
ncbi:hypothetical protein [Vreelandella aquamarina]